VIKISKYKIQKYIVMLVLIFIVLGFIGSFIVTFFIAGEYDPSESLDLTPLLPLNNFQIELPLTMLITMVSCILGSLLFGVIFGPILLYFHKILLGRKLTYGIQENFRTNKFKETFRGFFPMLMAVNFAFLIFQERELTLLFIDESQIQEPGAGYIFGIFVLVMVISGGTMGIFSATWFLMDSGIVYVKKKKNRKNMPIEVRSVGGWYSTFLKGYSSISTVITFYLFIFHHIFSAIPKEMIFDWYIILLIIGLVLLPGFLSLLALPAILILDMICNKRERYMQKVAKKMGIIYKFDSNSLTLPWDQVSI
jgi:hypothetical protein